MGITSGTGTSNCSEAPKFTPGFKWGSLYSIFSFICMFCRSLFVLLYFFFWPLWYLFFFDIRILFTSLVSSSSASWTTTVRFFKKKYTLFISGTMLLKFSFTSAKKFEVFLYDLLILWFKILKTSWFKHNSYIERDKRLYYIISVHIKLKIE